VGQPRNKKVDSPEVREYLRVKARYTGRVEEGSASDGTASSQWGGVKMSFFTSYGCSTSNLNNQSIVTVFEYADSKIIIPGDNQAESWKELVKDPGFVAAAKNPDVLLAPHHGRKAGYCPELFDAIGKTYITVISDGPEGETSARHPMEARAKVGGCITLIALARTASYVSRPERTA
jgi:competence protein ComEC